MNEVGFVGTLDGIYIIREPKDNLFTVRIHCEDIFYKATIIKRGFFANGIFIEDFDNIAILNDAVGKELFFEYKYAKRGTYSFRPAG